MLDLVTMSLVNTNLVLVEEHVELRDADAQVGLVELVADVPAERPELAPLLHHRVEEAQREQELLERLRLLVALEPLQIVYRVALVRPGYVCS